MTTTVRSWLRMLLDRRGLKDRHECYVGPSGLNCFVVTITPYSRGYYNSAPRASPSALHPDSLQMIALGVVLPFDVDGLDLAGDG